jgi:site-specific recombinase XerD
MKVRKTPPFRREDEVNLKQFLDFLQEKCVIQISEHQEGTAVDEFVAEFASYLAGERALSQSTIEQYTAHAVPFLKEYFEGRSVDFSTIDSVDVSKYVQRTASKKSRKNAKLMCTALRALFRYARHQGFLTTQLDAAVPSVANWKLASIPYSLPAESVKRILSSCNRETCIGKRDYAIILLLARLGLRAGEIITLSLEDIDWRSGIITVHGKGSHRSQMPLPPDVGEALAAYLQFGRPKSSSRRVFLKSQAPICGFKRSGPIATLVNRAIKRSGITGAKSGAHQFRHSIATNLLSGGASLSEIAELLRHGTIDCTTIYAKVDLPSLRTLALPWPGGDK